MSMRVKYIGKKKWLNSFGTFEPGKEYDVPKDVAFSLLSVPILFQLVETEEVKEPEKFEEKPEVIKKKVIKRKKRKKWQLRNLYIKRCETM